MSNIKEKKKPEKLRKGMAYVEYLAKKSEIDNLFEKGYTMKRAHEILTEKEIILMSYQSFYRHVTTNKKEKQKILEQPVSVEKQQLLEKKMALEKQQVAFEKQQVEFEKQNLLEKQVALEKQQMTLEKQKVRELEKKQVKPQKIEKLEHSTPKSLMNLIKKSEEQSNEKSKGNQNGKVEVSSFFSEDEILESEEKDN